MATRKSNRNGNPHPDRIRLPISRKPRILILGDPNKPRAKELAEDLADHLLDRAKLLDVEFSRTYAPIESKPDLVIVLGGDGAMLATSARLGNRQVPVLGINLGKVGFLTAVSPERALEVLDRVLEGRGTVEKHAMMRTKIRRKDKVVLDTHLLNEVVVRSWGSMMIDVDLTIDRRPVCTYRGDGLIVATATGTTAYNLAAGGPLMSPRLDAWVVTPIAPHMLGMRPLVIPGQRIASLQLHAKAGFTADGHERFHLRNGDLVRVGPSRRCFQLVVDPEANFYHRLRTKLRWGLPPGPG